MSSVSSSHLRTYIAAPVHLIWTMIYQNAVEYGTILTEKAPSLLVARSGSICYVYGLHPDRFMPSRVVLRLVITDDMAAAAALAGSPDIFRSIDLLPGYSNEEQLEFAAQHLEDIRRQVERQYFPLQPALAQPYRHTPGDQIQVDNPLERFILRWLWLIMLVLVFIFCRLLMA